MLLADTFRREVDLLRDHTRRAAHQRHIPRSADAKDEQAEV
jgi:hypothetical protein